MSAIASRRRSPKTTVSLREDIVRSSAPCKVDLEKGVIYDLKMGGLESENGREYTLESYRSALGLYEGCDCNIDHPVGRATESRSARDRFGIWRNVRVKEDGLYGDLHFLKTHTMAPVICEAAERMPGAFGCSHNATGDSRIVEGVEVIEAITEVRSVDIVADPATTRSLRESREDRPMKTTLKKLIEQKHVKATPFGKMMKRLLEDAPQMGDVPMDTAVTDEEDPAAEPGDYKSHLLAAIASLLESDDPEDHAKVDGIMKILKPKKPVEEDEDPKGDTAGGKEKGGEKTTAAESKEDDEKDMEEAECSAGSMGKGKMESIRRDLHRLQRKDKARELCEAAGVIPDKTLLEALIAVDDKTMKALIEREKKGKTRAVPVGPRSGSYFTESTNGQNSDPVPADRKSFLAGLTRR